MSKNRGRYVHRSRRANAQHAFELCEYGGLLTGASRESIFDSKPLLPHMRFSRANELRNVTYRFAGATDGCFNRHSSR